MKHRSGVLFSKGADLTNNRSDCHIIYGKALKNFFKYERFDEQLKEKALRSAERVTRRACYAINKKGHLKLHPSGVLFPTWIANPALSFVLQFACAVRLRC